MIPNRYKWVVLAFGMAKYFPYKLKKIPGGYITKDGQRIVGKDVEQIPRRRYEGRAE